MRSVIGAVTLAAVIGLPVATASSADLNEPSDRVDRLGGGDRYETAALFSQQLPDDVDTVYLANGENWAQGADAVVAGAAAGSGAVPPIVLDASGRPAPILLVKGLGIPSATMAALDELDPDRAIILGGTEVIAPFVDAELVQAGIEPIRVFGENRYGTAAALALSFDPRPATVYVASGQPHIPRFPFPPTLPDALTASARAGAEGVPVVLTTHSRLPDPTRAVLQLLEPESITIVGGHGAVSVSVEVELAQYAPVTRIGGETRFETAALLFESYGTGVPRTYLASGEWPSDALTLAPLAAVEGAPVLLAPQAHLPLDTRDGLIGLRPDTVRLVGGTGVLNEHLIALIEDLLDPTD